MKQQRAHDLVLAGVLVLSLLMTVLPLVLFVRQSFFESEGMGMVSTQPSTANYAAVLTDRLYFDAFVRTVRISFLSALFGLLLAYPTAYVLARKLVPMARHLVVAILATSVISVVVKVLGLSLLLNASGPVASVLGVFWPEPPRLLHNERAVVIGLVQYSLPLLVMLLMGVIQTISRSLEEAAALHGASDFAILRRVLLPLTLNGALTAGLIAFNMNMGAFTSAVLLGGGNVLTVPVLIQRKILLDVDFPMAATLAVLLTLSVFLINAAVLLLRRRQTPGSAP